MGIDRRGFVALGAGAALGWRTIPRGVTPRMRGVWLATVKNAEWPSKPGLPPAEQQAELRGWLDLAVRLRLNAVFLQVRPTADAFWPSPYEPWSQYLTGTQGRSPGYDPLGFAVAEAHRRGLQLHAWCNPYRVSLQSDPAALAPGHPARQHPEWVVRYGGQLWYDPGHPEARRHVVRAVTDAVARYPVDGLHFDDYFYPYPVAGQEFDDRATFAAYGKGRPDRAAWRRQNTELLIREVRTRTLALRPRAAFGVSPFGVWRNAATDPAGSRTSAGVQSYDDLYADTLGWGRRGLLDYLAPQLYWNIGFKPADYAVLTDWWARALRGTRTGLYPGEAAYRVGAPDAPAAWRDPAELTRHLELDRRYPEIGGNIFYDATALRADPLGAVSALVRKEYPSRVPAPVPGR
jgi:uncharacterized lipoprotein YddW (UPF0748 family)